MATFDLFEPERSSDRTLSAGASPARISRSRVVEGVSKASEAAYGENTPELWATFDHDSLSWKTSALSLLEDSPPFSETLPRSGMTRNGTLYRLPPLTRLIYGSDAGLLPTPTATEYGTTNNGQRGDGTTYATAGKASLWTMARRGLLPTPRASEYKGTGPLGSKSHSHRLLRGYLDATMQEATGETGRLSPPFVESMMGLPVGWTELGSDASVMPSSRKSRKSSDGQ
jgi:hypothetical protein